MLILFMKYIIHFFIGIPHLMIVNQLFTTFQTVKHVICRKKLMGFQKYLPLRHQKSVII